MRRQPRAVGGPYDDYLMAGAGQAVRCTVASDGIVEDPQPFFHTAVTCDNEAGSPIPCDDDFVEVGRLLGPEPPQIP